MHFYQPKKLQATDQTLLTSCRQRHTNENFSRQRAGIPSSANFFPPCFFTEPNVFRPPTYFLTAPAGQQPSAAIHLSIPAPHNRQQPTTPRYQPASTRRQHLFLQSKSPPATSHKKTEPSAQFFPLYISSTFPGLYNPQFSSCSTKPKCLRMPAKSGSLLLSSVITGLSFFSHSRLNSISLLPRPL